MSLGNRVAWQNTRAQIMRRIIDNHDVMGMLCDAADAGEYPDNGEKLMARAIDENRFLYDKLGSCDRELEILEK